MTYEKVPGNMCRTTIRQFESPSVRAAKTNCRSRNDSAIPRITRAELAQPIKLKIAMINKYTFVELKFGGNVARNDMIKYNAGMDMINSHTRMITLSVTPPK